MARLQLVCLGLLLAVGCSDNKNNNGGGDGGGGAGGGGGGAGDMATVVPTQCNGSVATQSMPGMTPVMTAGLTVPAGFQIETIAAIGQARELAALPNGDLLVGTLGNDLFLLPNAEADGAAGKPVSFASINDAPVQSVAFATSTCTVYAATQHGVYSMAYQDGATSGHATQIGNVRTGSVAPNSDGDVHTTSTVAVGGDQLYVGVGSSCNACTEVDPTRATIQQLGADGSNMTTRATRMRNAIGLAINPDTGTLWAGGAGQDSLPLGHPYEYFDAVGSHAGVADYGWPACEENHNAYGSGADCSATVAPILELPAYSTIIGAVFYPASQQGKHAFPAAYRGLFLAGHGSWHMTNGTYYTPPRVAFVTMSGDTPATPVDWNDPGKQWTEFLGGCQLADNVTRIARPTGIAIGKEGSLFVADDMGYVYRIRPTM